MKEETPFSYRRPDRRSVLKYGIGTVVTVSFLKLGNGISLDPPPQERTFKLFGGPHYPSYPTAEETIRDINVVAPISRVENEIREQYSIVAIAKRAGNSMKGIDHAFSMNVQLLDIDANVIGDDVYCEHGIVAQARIPSLEIPLPFTRNIKTPNAITLPFVVDVNEKEFKLGRPNLSLKQALEYIAFRNKKLPPQDKKGVVIELKRGKFSSRVLLNMFSMINYYQINPYFFDNQIERLDYVRSIAGDFKADKNIRFYVKADTQDQFEKVINKSREKPIGFVLKPSIIYKNEEVLKAQNKPIIADIQTPQDRVVPFNKRLIQGVLAEAA